MKKRSIQCTSTSEKERKKASPPTTTNDLNDLCTFRFFFSVIFLIFLLVFGFSSLFFLYTQIHLFRVILGIFIGMLILDQTSARFTEEQTNERANKKKQQHYIEKKTNDAASLYKLSNSWFSFWLLSNYIPYILNGRFYFILWFGPKGSFWEQIVEVFMRYRCAYVYLHFAEQKPNLWV